MDGKPPELTLDEAADLAFRVAMTVIQQVVDQDDQQEVKRRVATAMMRHGPLRRPNPLDGLK